MKIFFLFFIFLIKIIFCEICNYSISCNNDNSQNYCATKRKTESNNIFEIKVQTCPSIQCNIYNTLLGSVEKNVSCDSSSFDLKYKHPSYPGGICITDRNCLSGICLQDKCVDSLLDEPCQNHENCPLNSACIKGKCKPYIKDGLPCEDSYQCQYDSFCNKKTNKCQKLFYFKDGEEITDIIPNNERTENLCKSGGFIIEQNENGALVKKCETLYNIEQNCNDVCRYKRSSSELIFVSEEKCMCGYNKYRSKFCVLGNGEEKYKNYLNNKKNFMQNQEFTKFCHTLERDLDEICLQLINTNLTVPFRKYVKDYNNKKILALQHHRLQESEECVKEVIFNYDNKDVFSLTQSCPAFSCEKEAKNCLFGKNPLKDDGTGITVELNDEVCHLKEYCSLPEENKIINASLIMQRQYLEGQCKIFQENKNNGRYPGEDCYFNTDCLFDYSICQNGKCTGFGPGENCSETSQCTAGNYCNKETGKCTEQREEGQICVEGWDCKNYLGCYRGRCIKFGTLKKGIKLSPEFAPFPGNDKRHYLCYTGELEQGDGISGNFCVENDYNEHWVRDDNKFIDEKGFIKCNYGEKCFYNNGKNKFEKDCECGYNDKGQGYCPLPSARNLEKWNDRIKFIGNAANNGCHSLSRFDCYLKNDFEFYSEQRKHDAETLEAHLFYNSVDCAYKIFAKQNYIKFRFYFIGLLFILLF